MVYVVFSNTFGVVDQKGALRSGSATKAPRKAAKRHQRLQAKGPNSAKRM